MEMMKMISCEKCKRLSCIAETEISKDRFRACDGTPIIKSYFCSKHIQLHSEEYDENLGKLN